MEWQKLELYLAHQLVLVANLHLNSADSREISSVYDSTNGKVVIAYQDRWQLEYGTAVVGTVSGTSISFGSAKTFESATTPQWISTTYDSSNGKVVIVYQDDGNSICRNSSCRNCIWH